jgi:hypothetical protein
MNELGLFIEEKQNFTKKTFRRSAIWRDFMAVQMKKFVRPLLKMLSSWRLLLLDH